MPRGLEDNYTDVVDWVMYPIILALRFNAPKNVTLFGNKVTETGIC